MLGLTALNDVYQQKPETGRPDLLRGERAESHECGFPHRRAGPLARIPEKGKIVLVANHPFGGIEGIIMGAILQRVRPDVKIMANYLLSAIPEMRDLFIFVDPVRRSGSGQGQTSLV